MIRSMVIHWVGCVLILVLMTLVPATTAGQDVRPDADGFITAQPEDFVPSAGSRSVRILGDPGEPESCVMRLTFAPGTGTRPHFHD